MSTAEARVLALTLSSLILPAVVAVADVTRIVIDRVEEVETGMTGAAGPYVQMHGRAFGELDPADRRNAVIQDLELAPRNARGRVEYAADFVLTRPTTLSLGSGLLRYDAPNRGNVRRPDPWLLERGHVGLSVGWQGDVPADSRRLRVEVPVARGPDGRPIVGIVRSELITRRAAPSLPLSGGAFSGTHLPYAVASEQVAEPVLTRRRLAGDPAATVPRRAWRFADCREQPFPGRDSETHICLEEGFDPAFIYELTYTARDPLVLGIGFAATRDVVSFFRYEVADASGTANPVGGTIRHAIGGGVSQSGNFVKTLTHLGFNEDESGRRVFDGVLPLIAARHTALNVRFGQPGRGGGQREDHLYPGHAAPSTWAPVSDDVAGRTAGMLTRCRVTGTCPLVVHPLSTAEYWHLQASPTHTDARGRSDLELPSNVRIYLLASTQHTPRGGLTGCRYPANPNPYAETVRALTLALERWVVDGVEPPRSRVPRIDDGTLVRPETLAWPAVPGVVYTGLVNAMPWLDFGPDYRPADESGIVREPPRQTGREHAILVPQVDDDGNDLAGIRSTTARVPLGTYTGWNYRPDGDACILSGAFFPFAVDRAERDRTGDPRRSLEERYGDHRGYVDAVSEAAAALVTDGFLLEGDAERLIAEAEASDVLR